MSSHTTIEEIDIDEPPKTVSPFQSIFEDHQRKPYKFLTSAFDFLAQETSFFEQSEASKLLARLLRDTKAKKSPAKAGAPATAQPAANGISKKPVSRSVHADPCPLSPVSQLLINVISHLPVSGTRHSGASRASHSCRWSCSR